MLTTDAAYLAGLIDGEGTISIYRCRQSRYRNGFNYRPMIEISNTHLEVLQWVHSLVGDGWLKITNPGNVKRKHHKPLYRIKLRTSDFQRILLEIRPYLKIKSEQADILLEYFSRVTNTRPRDREDTERLACKLNQLNRRGTLST